MGQAARMHYLSTDQTMVDIDQATPLTLLQEHLHYEVNQLGGIDVDGTAKEAIQVSIYTNGSLEWLTARGAVGSMSIEKAQKLFDVTLNDLAYNNMLRSGQMHKPPERRHIVGGTLEHNYSMWFEVNRFNHIIKFVIWKE